MNGSPAGIALARRRASQKWQSGMSRAFTCMINDASSLTAPLPMWAVTDIVTVSIERQQQTITRMLDMTAHRLFRRSRIGGSEGGQDGLMLVERFLGNA